MTFPFTNPIRVKCWLTLPAIVEYFGGNTFVALMVIDDVACRISEGNSQLEYFVTVEVY